MPAGLGVWGKTLSERRNVRLRWCVGSKEERSMGQGSLWLLLLYSAWWGWDCKTGSGTTERKEKVYWQLTWFSCRQSLWVSRRCLLELEAGIKQLPEGRKVRRSWTVRSTGDGDWRKAAAGVLSQICGWDGGMGWERMDFGIHRLLNDSIKSKWRCYF